MGGRHRNTWFAGGCESTSVGWCFQILPYLEQSEVYREPEPWLFSDARLQLPDARRLPKPSAWNRHVGDYAAVTPSDNGNVDSGMWHGSTLVRSDVGSLPEHHHRTTTSMAPAKDSTDSRRHVEHADVFGKRLDTEKYTDGDWHDDAAGPTVGIRTSSGMDGPSQIKRRSQRLRKSDRPIPAP